MFSLGYKGNLATVNTDHSESATGRALYMHRFFMVLATCATLLACSENAPDVAGMRLAYEDGDAGRIGVCDLEGGDPDYITPDSLIASCPVTDSLRNKVYFIARRRSQPDALASIYSVSIAGTDLRQVSELPISPLELQITPDGTKLLFVGRYPDEKNARGYQMMVGESGFNAVTPANRSVQDIAMAPGGLNFVWNDGTHGDTLLVSSLQQFLTLGIFPFPYTQVSLRWPDGRAFAAVCGPHRQGLCYNLIQDSTTGEEVRKETILVEEKDGVAISQPAFHPASFVIAYVETETSDDESSQLCLFDRNSLKITRIPLNCDHPRHPVWVH